MQRVARIFVVPKLSPNAPPIPSGERLVEAPTIDGLRAALREMLTDEGHRVRAISFAKDVMIAYVEERA